jgi:hypothetical protein
MLNLFENLCQLREWCISNFQAYWAFQTDESFSKIFKFQRSLAISELLEKFQTMVVRYTHSAYSPGTTSLNHCALQYQRCLPGQDEFWVYADAYFGTKEILLQGWCSILF